MQNEVMRAYGRMMLVLSQVLLLCGLMLQVPAGGEQRPGEIGGSACPGTPWPAVDGLGRALPLSEEVGSPKAGRFVGIFYFLVAGQWAPLENGPFDVSKILRANPDALKTPTSPPWGPENFPHYWGEPLFGYYRAEDPWVLRRHAHLLADAGIDTLIFDTTNRVTFRDVYMKICEAFSQVRKEGSPTPQIVFMVNTQAGETAQELFNDLYKPGLYPDLWFRWQGKPLLICDPAQASSEVRAFFTLRGAHWPFELVNTAYAWHWEATYPQPYGFTDDPNVPEQVNVSIAQNLRAADGKVTNMSRGDARGRSFHDGQQHIEPGSVDRGYNFQEQWERAHQLAPPFVMVTGWNEWIAGRFKSPGEPISFCDQYNQEFSRDIEMTTASHQDNYYYQLVANVRRYKGAPPVPQATAPKSIDINGPFGQWADVGPSYFDAQGETLPRDFPGVDRLHYANTTGRNDLVLLKVARDASNVYFYAKTRADITPCTDPHWMMLLIDADRSHATGWEGFDFIVNREVVNATTTVIERNAGGWHWEKVVQPEVRMRVEGDELHLAIPRTVLNLQADARPLSFDFKWADNLQQPGDVMDFYVSGDVAPDGRFTYRYLTAD